MSLPLAIFLTALFTIFGLLAALLLGWIYDEPLVTILVVAVAGALALRPPRSSRRSRIH